ncbi:hypothetical protein [Candidatus Magnetominusculus xianensis]|uniref:Periplasmic heavy metal sensor n=1 Tax=Candidatus Magnetominusculus xianensis TaxID=1748249 RepID=A0ABR5SG34_9BACT|nr:hypothetical protein [Candidatus Magnetominusculus xianensis]KWT84931.1 hypothetical protein ASN18_1861 [Candidatus Magnetominusculus xianensis]MBF0404487.1 hypothetical protein [Nitrospirota bacterium]
MKKSAAVIVVLCLMMFAVTCNAETEKQNTDRKMHNHEQFKTAKRQHLLKALDLDKETSAKLTAVLDSYDTKRHDAKKSMKDNIKDLREAVKNKKGDAIKDLLGKLESNHAAFKALMESEKTEIKGILSEEQQARYILFMVDFHKKLRKSMHRNNP